MLGEPADLPRLIDTLEVDWVVMATSAEPTGEMLDLMREVRERLGTAIVLITHNLGVVADLDATVEGLAAQGVRFRGEVVEGPGGRQILIEDPAGNPVELFQPRSA